MDTTIFTLPPDADLVELSCRLSNGRRRSFIITHPSGVERIVFDLTSGRRVIILPKQVSGELKWHRLVKACMALVEPQMVPMGTEEQAWGSCSQSEDWIREQVTLMKLTGRSRIQLINETTRRILRGHEGEVAPADTDFIWRFLEKRLNEIVGPE